MKKRLLIISFLLLSLFLCACGNKKTIVIHSPDKEISGNTVPVTAAPIQNHTEPSATPTAESADTPAPEPVFPVQWYGWWRMYSTSGDWKSMYGYWWDCCAELITSEQGSTLLIWDEDVAKDSGLARLTFTFDGSSAEAVSMSMLDRNELEKCSMKLYSDELGQCLLIKGKYSSVSHKGGFSFEMLLRPWGSKWNTSEDLPYYYKDWYLPLISSGSPMPEKIGE